MPETGELQPKSRRYRRLLVSLAAGLLAAALTAGYLLGGDFISLWPVARETDGVTAGIEEAELSTHVHFLAHPALKGRIPLSMGSRRARAYIAERFRNCGLRPWGDAEDYPQPFSLGTNVVGVLPGSDASVSGEYVLLTAHHDHLGKGRLGACDNASGVAALLEVAEWLSQGPQRPRRPVAFAVFDREEDGLIGAYAFGSRKDFRKVRVRAVLNADMLGRHFLELLDNGVIVSGSEFYPETRDRLFALGKAQGVEPYAAGLDLAGMRGDHAAFLASREGATEPPLVLFFSCGSFEGYHTAEDTADRIDYPLLARSTRFLGECARELADARGFESRGAFDRPDRAELALFGAVGAELLGRGEAAGLTENDRKACEWWLGQADEFYRGPSYTFEDRRYLVQYLATLGPPVRKLLAEAMGNGTDAYPSSEEILGSLGAAGVWMRYGTVFDAGYRGFVEQIVGQETWSLALRGLPEPDYAYRVPWIADGDVVLQDLGGGTFRLSFFSPEVSVDAHLGRFGESWMNLSIWGRAYAWEGTREDLTDIAILYWSMNLPREADTRRLLKRPHPSVTEKDVLNQAKERRSPHRVAGVHAGYRRVLETVTGERHGEVFEDWAAWRVRRLGYPNREAWVDALLEHDHPLLKLAALAELRRAELKDFPARVRTACTEILADPAARAEHGVAALAWLRNEGEEEGLRRLVDYLEDETVVERTIDPTLDESNPLHEHPVVRYGTPVTEWTLGDNPPLEANAAYTIGDVALHELKEGTGKDLGKNAAAWIGLIDAGLDRPSDDSCACSSHPAAHRATYYEWHQ